MTILRKALTLQMKVKQLFLIDNFYHLRPAAFFTSTLSRENIQSEALGTSPE